MMHAQHDDARLRRLLQAQHGLISRTQALDVGLTSSTIQRRLHDSRAPWVVILPGVYATFVQPLSRLQHATAGQLYAGATAVVTGLAALEIRKLRYLPPFSIVDILVMRPADHGSRASVRVEQTMRVPDYDVIDGIRVAAAARAAVDAARRLTSYDPVLALAAGVVQRRLATVDDLLREVDSAPRRGTKIIRSVLSSVGAGARSVAEGAALELFRDAGLPEPEINRDIVLPGQAIRCPDFRWGRLIVEIDSKEWHLLYPGSWDATQRRRKELERAGYVVLVVTPRELAETPWQVVADIRQRLATLAA